MPGISGPANDPCGIDAADQLVTDLIESVEMRRATLISALAGKLKPEVVTELDGISREVVAELLRAPVTYITKRDSRLESTRQAREVLGLKSGRAADPKPPTR